MPIPVILATPDAALAEAWARQCGGREVLRLGRDALPVAGVAGVAAVVVLDSVWENSLPPEFAACPTVLVGFPRSRPFEQARLAGRAKAYLSYEESTGSLEPLIPILTELAAAAAIAALAVVPAECARSTSSPRHVVADSISDGGVIAALFEQLSSPEGLDVEIRRIWRNELGAARADFFRLNGTRFETLGVHESFVAEPALLSLLARNPLVLDGRTWSAGTIPEGALVVANLLARRAARLIVPVHENGRLLGLFLLGLREDGRDYGEPERVRAVALSRVMRLAITAADEIARLRSVERRAALAAAHLPAGLVLEAGEEPSAEVPLVVREVVGEARHLRSEVRREPNAEQPFRVRGGLIGGEGGVWVHWDDASSEVTAARERDRRNRRALLRELALTLSHELGNALVSLATFRQAGAERPLPPAMLETMRADIARLQQLNTHLGLMQTLHEAEPGQVDVKEVAQEIGRSLGLRVEMSSESAVISADRRLLDFALRSLLETVGENRGELGLRELALKVRRAGEGAETIALVSLKGRPLELEGVLPVPAEGAVPNQGHLKVLLAREILTLHHGDIHAGPGMEGTEILIAIRHL